MVSEKYFFVPLTCSLLSESQLDDLRMMIIYSTVNSRLADTPIIQTVAKSPAKTNYRQLPLLRTP